MFNSKWLNISVMDFKRFIYYNNSSYDWTFFCMQYAELFHEYDHFWIRLSTMEHPFLMGSIQIEFRQML